MHSESLLPALPVDIVCKVATHLHIGRQQIWLDLYRAIQSFGKIPNCLLKNYLWKRCLDFSIFQQEFVVQSNHSLRSVRIYELLCVFHWQQKLCQCFHPPPIIFSKIHGKVRACKYIRCLWYSDKYLKSSQFVILFL